MNQITITKLDQNIWEIKVITETSEKSTQIDNIDAVKLFDLMADFLEGKQITNHFKIDISRS